jgi:hypothetical protein
MACRGGPPPRGWHPVTPHIDDPDLAPYPERDPYEGFAGGFGGPRGDPRGGSGPPPKGGKGSFFAQHRFALLVAGVVLVVLAVVLYVYLSRRGGDPQGKTKGRGAKEAHPEDLGTTPAGGVDLEELSRLRAVRRQARGGGAPGAGSALQQHLAQRREAAAQGGGPKTCWPPRPGGGAPGAPAPPGGRPGTGGPGAGARRPMGQGTPPRPRESVEGRRPPPLLAHEPPGADLPEEEEDDGWGGEPLPFPTAISLTVVEGVAFPYGPGALGGHAGGATALGGPLVEELGLEDEEGGSDPLSAEAPPAAAPAR